MAQRWQVTTERYALRFFSPEQVDRMLREGADGGPAGSHAAIERILRHEPEVPRALLWSRIRQLKYPAVAHRCRSSWSAEDEELLRGGYRAGWRRKRATVCMLLKRHPGWRPHVIWKRAAKLGLTCTRLKRGQERSHEPWSAHDEQLLLELAGYKSVRVIAKLLHRSSAAVRNHLILQGKSTRAYKDGFARSALSRELHISAKAVQRLIALGFLEVRDPRITRESIEALHRSGLDLLRGGQSAAVGNRKARTGASTEPQPAVIVPQSGPVGLPSQQAGLKPGSSRAMRVWAESARVLGISLDALEKLIVRGALKFYDPTITETSVISFCRRYGSLIEADFLSRDARRWLQSAMEWNPAAGAAASVRFAALRKHARAVRRCVCGRSIRGNAYFRHMRKCLAATGVAIGSPRH